VSAGGLRWPALALVAGAPLVVDPGGHHRYTALRFLFLAVVVTVGLAVGGARRQLVFPRFVSLAWMVAVAVALLAARVGVDTGLSILGDPVRLMGAATAVLLFGAFVVGASSGLDARTVGTALLIGGAVVVVVGLAQIVGVVEHHGRTTSTLGNAGFLGAYLCLLIPVAGSRVMSIAGRERWATVALLGGAVVVLLGSGTRGAWIGVVVGFVVLGVLNGSRMAAAEGAVIVVALLVAGPFVGRSTAEGRLDTWGESMAVLADRPALGWGPEGFRTGFARHVSASWVRRYSLDQLPDRAHNRFIDVAASTGVVGLVVDVALIAGVVVAARRALRRATGEAERWAVVGIAAGLAAWLAQGQFLFDTFDLALVAWVLVGVLTVGDEARLAAPERPTALLVVPLVGVVVLAGLNFAADREVMRASGRPALVAVNRLTTAAHLRPRALDVYLLTAEVAVRSRDPAALNRAHDLLRRWDDDEVRVADARVLAALGRHEDAVAIADGVTRRQPTDPRAWLVLGDSLRHLGRRDVADTALRRAVYLCRCQIPESDDLAPTPRQNGI
jgi:O-antigen ligase